MPSEYHQYRRRFSSIDLCNKAMYKWKAIAAHVPQDLSGWEVLDVGCNAGFYSIELARRGAHVTAVDIDPHYLDQARWAAQQFGVQDALTFKQMPIYALAHAPETYDLVWFMGCLLYTSPS